jgi:hypothetical protein
MEKNIFGKYVLQSRVQQSTLVSVRLVGSLFYDAFLVPRLYSVDDMMNNELERIW